MSRDVCSNDEASSCGEFLMGLVCYVILVTRTYCFANLTHLCHPDKVFFVVKRNIASAFSPSMIRLYAALLTGLVVVLFGVSQFVFAAFNG